MLELLDDDYSATAAEMERICRGFDQRLTQINNAFGSGDRAQVARLESQAASGAFQFDSEGWARLGDYEAGRFACPSIQQLRQRLAGNRGARLRLFVLEGMSKVTDIGALQAAAPEDSLFQVASQFNCLESPGDYLVRVQDYFSDPTQGPRASISAFPGTLLRHYAAPGPDGQRFQQGEGGRQLNLLHRVTLDGVARVESGYLLPTNIQDRATFANLLKDHFEDLEVGLHEGVQVVLGADWDGPVSGRRQIAQVFTSTVAAGGYGRLDFQDLPSLEICRQLQRAAYLGTLLGAAALGQRRVILTLIGGGVFGNPTPIIWDSILWACRQVAPSLQRNLTVILNGRNLAYSMELDKIKASARKLGGDMIVCSPRGATID